MDLAKSDLSIGVSSMDDKAINDFYRMADNLDKPVKPKISSQQEYWQGQAIKLAQSEKMSMAVVEIDAGHYQVWPLAKFGSDNVYVAEYVQEVATND